MHPNQDGGGSEEEREARDEKPFLPPQITLHTTARPGKAHLPPHLKNKDTVVLSLPKMRPTDVPDGWENRFITNCHHFRTKFLFSKRYELIPLDQLTPDHEVVPWTEAKQVLKVDVAPLGEPKRKKEGEESQGREEEGGKGGEPQSG